MEIFNEQKLRAEIAKTWGEHGVHIEVYDMLLKKANVVLPQANVIKSVCDVSGRSELLIAFAHHLKNIMTSGKSWSIESAVESFKSN